MSLDTQQLPIRMRVTTASKMFDISKSKLWGLIKTQKVKVYRPSEKITLLDTNDLIAFLSQDVKNTQGANNE